MQQKYTHQHKSHSSVPHYTSHPVWKSHPTAASQRWESSSSLGLPAQHTAAASQHDCRAWVAARQNTNVNSCFIELLRIISCCPGIWWYAGDECKRKMYEYYICNAHEILGTQFRARDCKQSIILPNMRSRSANTDNISFALKARIVRRMRELCKS